jgi:hypothetical protein
MWLWLTQSNAGLLLRIGIGVLVFALLAVLDWRRHGREARRWREYLFLLSCIAAAMLYGIVNDTITSSISWEYFCYGKGLWPDVIHDLPPAPLMLHRAAAVVGMKATWTAGLLIGAAMLIANNPAHARPQLPYSTMLRLLLVIAAVAAGIAAACGVVGYFGGLTWISHDFSEMTRRNEMRPDRFIAVFGVHLGGYAGGLVGLMIAILAIRRRRRQLLPSFKSSDTLFAHP